MNILIVRLSALGDVLHCLPSLRALRDRYPDATIDWLVEEGAAEILRPVEAVDEVIVLPRKNWARRAKRLDLSLTGEIGAFFRSLRQRRYSVAIDFQGNFRSGLVTYLSRARLRIGFSRKFSKELNGLFTNRKVVPRPDAKHKVDRDLQLLRGLGTDTGKGLKPLVQLPPDPAAAEQVAAFVESLPRKKGKLVVIHPGTSRFGSFKSWPPERFAALGRRLAAETKARIVVTWGPGEEELAGTVAEGIGEAARVSRPTGLAELTELIRRADLFVSSDTGPMNIAPLVGTATVTLFGPKDPAVYAPRSERSEIVVKDIPCRPCNLRRCAAAWCMKWITPEEALAPALRLLRS